MWLRLTGQNGRSTIINMDNINCVDDNEVTDHRDVWFNDDAKVCVKESIDEIEIILAGKGAEVKRADPHARDFIGGKIGQQDYDR